MDRSDEVKALLSEEFSPKPMNSGEFGTRHQEFGALHRTNWISLNLAQVGIELWWVGRTIFDFSFVVRPITLLSILRLQFKLLESKFSWFLPLLFASTGFFRIPWLFFVGKSNWFFVGIVSFVSTCYPNLGCFSTSSSQTYVLPNPCFANDVRSTLLLHNVPSSLLGFSFLPR